MNLEIKRRLGINLLGGGAVIGSCLFCLASHPTSVAALWGSTPQEIRFFT